MTKFLNLFKTIPHYFLWSLLSGVLVGISYIPFKTGFFWICYIPLWVFIFQNLNQLNYKKIFFAGWITQFVLTLIGFNWIYYVASEFGQLHPILSAGALLLFASAMHVYIPFSLLLATWLVKSQNINSKLAQFFIAALCLALFERIWPSIFEWNLAYSLLWMNSSLSQWADTIGFWGLSSLILVTQAALCYVIVSLKTQKKQAFILFSGILLGLTVLGLIGEHKKNKWISSTDSSLNVAVAQGNVGNAEKVQSEQKNRYHSFIRLLYTNLTEQELQKQSSLNAKIDLVIWPETALPFAMDEFYHNRIEQRKLLESIRQWQGPTLVTGGYSVSQDRLDHLGYNLHRNAVFYIHPEGHFSAPPYFKTNLLVFGEYMPLGEQFPFLYKLLPFVGVYEKGSGPIVAELKLKDTTVHLGPQICYDSLVPDFSRKLALNGAQILFNVTNDSWFGWWAEPFQHQYMTLARALEVRRPLVRSTNTGVSSAILASGEVLTESPIGEKWIHTYQIPYTSKPKQTFYSLYGYLDWVFWLLVLVLIIFYFRNTHNRTA